MASGYLTTVTDEEPREPYELYDSVTRNVIKFFPTEEAARDWVQYTLLSGLILGYEDEDGKYHVIARGENILVPRHSLLRPDLGSR